MLLLTVVNWILTEEPLRKTHTLEMRCYRTILAKYYLGRIAWRSERHEIVPVGRHHNKCLKTILKFEQWIFQLPSHKIPSKAKEERTSRKRWDDSIPVCSEKTSPEILILASVGRRTNPTNTRGHAIGDDEDFLWFNTFHFVLRCIFWGIFCYR